MLRDIKIKERDNLLSCNIVLLFTGEMFYKLYFIIEC